jgi:peptide/nickel transport system substrate-binding protein
MRSDSDKKETAKISRRQFIKNAIIGASVTATGAVLAGCAPAATPAPTAAPTSAPAPTKAPEATKAPAPTATPAPTKAPRPKRMRIAYSTDINFMDPALMQSAPEWMPSYLLYDPLVRYDQTMLEPKPALAESWTKSDDGKTWVFKIRKGVKYHTGREMKAEDIQFSWRRAIDVGAKGRAAGFLIDVADFKATGDYEFTVTLKAFSWNFFPNCATMSIVAVDKDTVADIATKPVGTGPYKLAEWKQGQHILYQKFADYWDKERLAKLPDEIQTLVIPEMQTAIANLTTGDVDVVSGVGQQFLDQLTKTQGIRVLRQTPFSAAYQCFDFNLKEGPFKDKPLLRKAIARAINREAINKNAYFGLGETDCNFIPTKHWCYTKLPCDQISYNLDEAKKLLKEAGGEGLSFECIADTASLSPVRSAEIIQEDLKKIGVTMKITAVEFTAYVKDYWVPKKGDTLIAGYTREADPDGMFSSVLRKAQGNNWMGYEDAEIEKLFDEGKTVLDQKARIPIYEKLLTKALIQDIPLVKLHTRAELWAANAHVKGMDLLPKGYPNLWDFEWV